MNRVERLHQPASWQILASTC